MAEQNKQPQNNQKPEQDVNQLLKVRREKLAALQEAGKDPFRITRYDQTHHTDILHMRKSFLQDMQLPM